jgi:UDPglucose 6-dehydrogenase
VFDEQYTTLEGADALAVVTDWNQFRNPDFVRIKKRLRAPIIFDGRNLYSSTLVASQGFAYFAIGRPNVKSQGGRSGSL